MNKKYDNKYFEDMYRSLFPKEHKIARNASIVIFTKFSVCV